MTEAPNTQHSDTCNCVVCVPRGSIKWKECSRDRHDDMLGVIYPAARGSNRQLSAFLVGEPHDHDRKTGEFTFRAFAQDDNDNYFESEPMTFREFQVDFPKARLDYRN